MAWRRVLGGVALVLLIGSTAEAEFTVQPTGRIYADWYYNLSGYPDWDERVGQDDASEFELTRAYLGLKAQFSPAWSAVLMADVGRDTKQKVKAVYTEDKQGNRRLSDVVVSEEKTPYLFFIKYAYGQWMPRPYLALRLGSEPVPYIGDYEDAWGYRWVEKTPIDKVRWDCSADLGFAAQGSFPRDLGSYIVMLRNGEGYKHPEVDSGKAVHVALRLTPVQGSDYTKNLQVLAAYRLETEQAHRPEVRSHLIDALLSYNSMFSSAFGLNAGAGFDWLSTQSADQTAVNGRIVHGWITLVLPAGFAVFERVDWFDPDLRNDRKSRGFRDEETYNLTGISYNPVKGVDLAVDYRGTYYAAKVQDDQGHEERKPADHLLFVNAQFKF